MRFARTSTFSTGRTEVDSPDLFYADRPANLFSAKVTMIDSAGNLRWWLEKRAQVTSFGRSLCARRELVDWSFWMLGPEGHD